MNRTRRVLFVRAAGAGGGGPEALESEYEVVVAEGALDAIKRLSTEPVAPDCVVAPATPRDLPLETFLKQVRRRAPDVPIVAMGELPAEAEGAAALAEVDAYVPAGREAALPDRIRRIAGERDVERALGLHRRLERTVKSIAVDVAEAADRPAIESAVYDRLTAVDDYRHVWIAGSPGDGDLEVSVPVTGRLGAEELGDLVGGGDPAFVNRAVEAGRVVSTEGRVPTRSAASASPPTAATIDDLGTRTLASAAVPFVHDGRVLGVALVSTERDGAFDGSEREQLADLGVIVGHALWARGPSVGGVESDLGRGMENLVHDLRNSLGIARSYLEIAREDGEFEPLERVETALGRMEATIGRVADGVAGAPRADATPDDLEAAVRAAWTSVETASASITVADSATVRADRDLLVRLLANLFQNAVDHGGDDVGVTVGTLPDGFFVEDDGPGIPAAQRESVFDRGYSTSEDGLGIGLSIVDDVVNAHGWSVSVTAGESGGARFEITGVELVEEREAA